MAAPTRDLREWIALLERDFLGRGPFTRIASAGVGSGGCVPRYPPDVNCDDIRALGIAPVKVIGSDPHRLDGDSDGWGCE